MTVETSDECVMDASDVLPCVVMDGSMVASNTRVCTDSLVAIDEIPTENLGVKAEIIVTGDLGVMVLISSETISVLNCEFPVPHDC